MDTEFVIRTIDSLNPQYLARRGLLTTGKLYRRIFQHSLAPSRRRLRYGLLALNVAVLATVTSFIVHASQSGQAVKPAAHVQDNSQLAANPLDQLSSADIATHVARLTNLPEANSVANTADSVSAQLAIVPSETTVVAKPQVVATALKSRRDIQTYTTVAGDTVPNLAAKFGITSDTIRWSNNLSSDTLPAGKQLLISPVNGLVYEVKAGDTIDSIATKYRANKDQVVAFNDAEISGIKAGEKIVIPNGSVLPVATTPRVTDFAFGFAAIYGSNGYDYGWCTWYAANRRAELGHPVPANLGNAYSWYYRAQSAGLPTGTKPAVGAVAVNISGNHVSIVEAVNSDGSFWVSEMNSHGQRSMTDSTPWGGWRIVDWKFFGSAGNLKFIY